MDSPRVALRVGGEKQSLRLHASEAVRRALRVAGHTATQIRRGVRARNRRKRPYCRGTRRIGTACYQLLGTSAGGAFQDAGHYSGPVGQRPN